MGAVGIMNRSLNHTEKMHGVATALAALVLCAPCATGLRASGLRKTLGRGRKLVVEVALPDAADAWDLDVEEASAGVREAGAAALIVPEPLLRLVVAEQARAKGDFPGPLPVLCAMDAGAHTDELPALLAELSQATLDGGRRGCRGCPPRGSAVSRRGGWCCRS